ncbi:MAG: cyclic nucleotide-binding domain-containing protein [Lachnospiraceae bacterium]|nr:cyclic nucleotide-binding domain-containing protein [Lachnospiraceae bacterium]
MKVYKKGDVIFEEGKKDLPVMFDIWYGRVGIFKNYGTSSEVKLSELKEEYFGEMALVRDDVRSATAVALEETGLVPIGKEEMQSYFIENPYKMDIFLRTMSSRIRARGVDYMKACECIDEYRKAEQEGKTQDPELLKRMKTFVK